VTTTHDDVFFQVAHTRHDTSAGPVDFPISYYDTGELIALFEVDDGPVRQAMADVPLSLVPMGGKAWLSLVFFNYRDTSIGPYNEVGLATFAVPKGEKPPMLTMLDLLRAPRKRHIGFYVFKLPVTTAIANAAGRELWGFPKFVTPIDIDLGEKSFTGRVRDPDDNARAIAELSGALPAAVPCPPIELTLLSHLDGALLRSVVDVRGKHAGGLGGGLQLTVGDTEHPMAVQMRAFGLQGARAKACIFTRRSHSLLHLGDPVEHR
jgi:hypothetical protein